MKMSHHLIHNTFHILSYPDPKINAYLNIDTHMLKRKTLQYAIDPSPPTVLNFKNQYLDVVVINPVILEGSYLPCTE